jgi:hypothetical protein
MISLCKGFPLGLFATLVDQSFLLTQRLGFWVLWISMCGNFLVLQGSGFDLIDNIISLP